MKATLLSIILTGLCLLNAGNILAQTTTATSNSNHPTVSLVKVKYKAVSQSTVSGPQVVQGIKAIPQATVSLKSNINASKIHFRMMNGSDTLYYVNYSLDSPVVYNGSGVKLFERNDDKLYISSGQSVALKPYTVKVQTGDSLNALSAYYSLTQ